MDSRFRGNDGKNARHAIPAKAGIHTALNEHRCGAASASESGPEFDVQTAPVLDGWAENIPPAVGEDAIDAGDRVADGVR